MKRIFTFLLLLGLTVSLMAQWSNDPNQNNLVGGIQTDDVIPKVVTAANGHTYISWFSLEGGNYNVLLQQYDVLGNELFALGGMLVSNNPSMSWLTDYNMTVDKENCAIIGFQDIRTGDNNIYVYRISPDGQFLWGNNGLALSDNAAFEPYPVIAVMQENTIVFAWQSEENGQGVIRLQRVNPDSTRLWGPDGIIYQSPVPGENYSYPMLVPSDNNSVIMVFHKQTGSFMNPKYLWAQKFDAAGNPLWASDVAIYDGPGIPIIPQTLVEPDSLGGVVVCWHDTRAGMSLFNVFAQHLDNNGNELFVSQGQAVTTSTSYIQMNPAMAYNPSTQETYIFFDAENMNQSQWGLFGQKLDATGQLQWGNSMLTLIPVSTDDIEFIRARRANNQVLVTYEYYNFGNFSDARTVATLVDSQGNFVWTPTTTTICNVQSGKGHPVTGYFRNNQWILAWEDNRNGNPDVYAQNILLNGELGPDIVGIKEKEKAVKSLCVIPNPVRDAATIQFNCNRNETVQLTVYNVLGEKLACLLNGSLNAGNHAVSWNRTTADGRSLPSGIYFIEFNSADRKQTAKVVLQ